MEKLEFIDKIGLNFSNLLFLEKEKLWNLVKSVMESNKGALLVITEGYLEEAKRLSLHSTLFKPFEMKGDLIIDFSGIDGAILISPYRICSAIGVILDGVISDNGDPSRGARFNSALKYYDTQNQKHKMIIIIVSDDGTVDILG